MYKSLTFALALFSASAVAADAPRVVADIAPVHSLVSIVMGDIGAPELLVEPTVTPHSYALRASQAAALENADLVFVTSYALTPWLRTPLENLAQSALKLELMHAPETVHYDYREGEDDHAHEHEHGHDESGEEVDEELDPHGWLDPENAKLWVKEIAKALSTVDPDNATRYAANATSAVNQIAEMSDDLSVQMMGIIKQPYMVLHDGFQYFDRRFELTFVGSIALGDASSPSPARIAHAREELQEHNVQCVFTEPQQNDRLVRVVIEGTDAKTGVLDATGAKFSPGPALYFELMQGLADSLVTCLAD